MSRILICSDFLMTCDTEQDNNIIWLFDFINRPLYQATHRNVYKFSSGKNGSIKIDREIFFSKSNIQCDSFKKQFFYNADEITIKSKEYLKSLFKDDDILICYELSEQTKSILSSIRVNFIDIWLHPIRYMDDVLFGINSNNEKVNAELKNFNIPPETYYLYADRLKVQNYRGHRRSKSIVEPNSALFVGQTLFDKAIFSNGKMLSLLDFKKKFEHVTEKYKHVYYSRHPFVKDGDSEILDYIKKFRNVSINNDPAYHLLASKELKYVFSISSSVVHEAKYFGKESEFLYKPVIEIGDNNSQYISVMHEIYYSHFWSSILSPICPTQQVLEVSYFCGKDKTRDALSFYWGYRNIDKTESLKQTVSSLWDKSKNNSQGKNIIIKNKKETIFNKIDNYPLISFDIFDTLITRKTFSPREIFNIIEKKFNNKYEEKINGFKQFRVIAEDRAHKKALSKSLQECTLDEIYETLSEIMGITIETSNLLKQIELETELEYSIPRSRGMELFNYALNNNKNIILTSDMYLSKRDIELLLQKNKIFGYKKIFVSSEIKLKKKGGDLFKYISENLNTSLKDILHIGDNIDGDVKSPESIGIKAYRTPRSIDNAKFNNSNLKNWIDLVSVNKTPLIDSIITLISNKFYDNETTQPSSLFNGDAFEFGYKGFGPLIIGFTAWIRQQAVNNGIETLYFLSRDTKVVYDCFKELYPENSPEVKYLYSSRRSVKVPLIKNRNDILNEVYKTIYSTTISQWLESSFGLSREMYDEDILKQLELKGYDHPIGVKFSKEKLAKIVMELEEKIFTVTKIERDNILDYLKSEGLNTQDNIAVIDIGYAGTMQAAYRHLLKKDNIYGFYLATFNTALKNIQDTNLIKGYCMDFGSPNHSMHTISSHRFIYEALFCDADGSFIKPIKTASGFQLIKSTFDDSVRHSVVKEIHRGTLTLAEDLKRGMPIENLDSYVDPNIAGYAFNNYLKEPQINDAKLLSGIIFEDAVAPNARKYIVIPDNLKSDELAIKNMIWKEAIHFFKSKEAIKSPLEKTTKQLNTSKTEANYRIIHKIGLTSYKAASLMLAMERKIFSLTLEEKKFNKYLRDRDAFFNDSPQKISSIYYKKTSRLIK